MFVVNDGRLAWFLCLGPFIFPFEVGEVADLGEGGRNVGRGVVEGVADVADGDAHEVHVAPLSP